MTHHITYSTKRCGVYHGLLNYSNLVIREYIDLMPSYANALLHFNAFHKKPLKQRETLLRHGSSRYQEVPLYRHLTKTTHIILSHFSFKVSIIIQCWSMKSYTLTMNVDSVLGSSVWYSNTILIQWLYIVTLSKY